jgi:hypothetical protein
MSLPQRRETMLVTSVSFFNELATEKRNYARGCFLIMASKRIMLWKDTMSRDKTRSWLPRDLHQDGRESLWKEHMSRVMIGVRRSGSNNPTEEITMSTTGSKSSEVEVMGDNAT